MISGKQPPGAVICAPQRVIGNATACQPLETAIGIEPRRQARPLAPVLWRASVFGLAIVLLALAQFAITWRPANALEAAFVFFAWLDQSLLIAAPLFVVAALTGYLERRAKRGAIVARTMRVLFAVVATLVAATLLADVRIHELYGFHINGFVWNLVTTPGGIASMEASTETWLTVAVAIAVIFAAVLALSDVAATARRVVSAASPLDHRRGRDRDRSLRQGAVRLRRPLRQRADVAGVRIVSVLSTGHVPFGGQTHRHRTRAGADRVGVAARHARISAQADRNRVDRQRRRTCCGSPSSPCGSIC